MTRRGGPVLLWLVATAAAIAVASAAIAQVGRQVAVDAPLDARLAQATGAPALSPPAASQSASPGTRSPVASTPSEPHVRTYDVVGGRAAVALADGQLEVRWATPREGFRASVARNSDGAELRVEFRSESHRSRIDVAIEDGQVVDEVEEDGR